MNRIIGAGLCLWMSVSFLWAQEEDDIGIQEVTVVKSYAPTLRGVYKLRESPKLIDSILRKKQVLEYEIFSIPVASTFVPSKGAAKKLKPIKPVLQFNSRAALGFGNFNQLSFEYATQLELDRRQEIGWIVNYNGLLKNLESVDLPSQQGNLMLHLAHQYSTNQRNAFSKINFRQHQQAFYGLRIPIADDFIRSNIEAKQQLNYLAVSSKWQWYDPWVKELKLDSYLTTDAFSTSEIDLDLSAKFQVDWGKINFTLVPHINVIQTQFKEEFYSRLPVSYQSGIARLSIFASKIQGNFKFKIGAKGLYSTAEELKDQPVLVYPELTFSYRPKKGNFAPFLSLSGELQQNSFRKFSHANPYIAPGIMLRPSRIPWQAQLGTRSKFSSGWEFQWFIWVEKNEHLPMFRNLGYEVSRQQIIPYRLGNAYEVIYRSLLSSGVEAQLSAAFKNGGRLQLTATYANYNFDQLTDQTPLSEQTAFNLPALRLDFDGTFKVGNKIYLQWLIKHRGERTNAYRDQFLGQQLENSPVLLEDLPAFSQIDLGIQYQFNERWEIYLKGKNLANETYYQWNNYQVYGTQLLLGVRYNFDLAL